MQHFVEIYTSEGFAWGLLVGVGISVLLDHFIAWGKSK
jgi:hypothetical protein